MPGAMPSPSPPAELPPPPDGGSWDESAVERCTVDVLGKQGLFRPTVRLIEAGGVRLVVKDYRPVLAPYRWVVGRWNLAREEDCLRRLGGIDAVPRYFGRIGSWMLVMSWFRGTDLGKAPRALQTPLFFERLLAAVQEMHARGIVHLDLRQRRNILLRGDERPAIIDFGGAMRVRPGGRLHRILAPIDVSGVLKYKRRAQPDAVTDEESRLLQAAAKRRMLWPFG